MGVPPPGFAYATGFQPLTGTAVRANHHGAPRPHAPPRMQINSRKRTAGGRRRLLLLEAIQYSIYVPVAHSSYTLPPSGTLMRTHIVAR